MDLKNVVNNVVLGNTNEFCNDCEARDYCSYCVARNLKETGNMLSVNKKICEKAYWYKSVVEEGNKYAVKKKQ